MTLSDRLSAVEAVLAEWERVCEAATPGPWFWDHIDSARSENGVSYQCIQSSTAAQAIADTRHAPTLALPERYPGDPFSGVVPAAPGKPEDATFIVLSRTITPAMIAYLRADAEWARELLAAAYLRSERKRRDAEAIIVRLEAVTKGVGR